MKILLVQLLFFFATWVIVLINSILAIKIFNVGISLHDTQVIFELLGTFTKHRWCSKSFEFNAILLFPKKKQNNYNWSCHFQLSLLEFHYYLVILISCLCFFLLGQINICIRVRMCQRRLNRFSSKRCSHSTDISLLTLFRFYVFLLLTFSFAIVYVHSNSQLTYINIEHVLYYFLRFFLCHSQWCYFSRFATLFISINYCF